MDIKSENEIKLEELDLEYDSYQQDSQTFSDNESHFVLMEYIKNEELGEKTSIKSELRECKKEPMLGEELVNTDVIKSENLTVMEKKTCAQHLQNSVSQHTEENEDIEPSSQQPLSDQAQQINQGASSSNLPQSQKSKKKNVDINNRQTADELLELACSRLRQPASIHDHIATAWAKELEVMAPDQQVYAKKFINEILFEGQMGTLHRHSVVINQPMREALSTPLSSHYRSTEMISTLEPSSIYEAFNTLYDPHTTIILNFVVRNDNENDQSEEPSQQGRHEDTRSYFSSFQ
ncbi:UNVERIFIED_CONTAM: hypothetical protein RMT77_014870 [Armadillidium vulgare]